MTTRGHYSELYLSGKDYAYKTGDPAPAAEKGCSIDEATIALACARPEVAMAVHAKAKVSRLWEDITKPPYTLLFNENLSGLRLWRLVELCRAVEDEIKKEQKVRKGKSRLVALHGNRFITHQIFQRLPLNTLDNEATETSAMASNARRMVSPLIDGVVDIIAKRFPSAYPGSLFKNITKCSTIAQELAPSALALPPKKSVSTRVAAKTRRATGK